MTDEPKHSHQKVFCFCKETKKPWHKSLQCVAITDQVTLICFFTLHADNFACFIMQSPLGQSFLFSGLQFVSVQSIHTRGHKNKIPKTDESVKINRYKRHFISRNIPVFCQSEEDSRNIRYTLPLTSNWSLFKLIFLTKS